MISFGQVYNIRNVQTVCWLNQVSGWFPLHPLNLMELQKSFTGKLIRIIFWTWPALCLTSHSASFCSAAHYQKWWTGNSPHRTSTCCPTAFQSDNRGGTSCAVEESFETVHHVTLFLALREEFGRGESFQSMCCKMVSVYAEGGIRECVFVSQWRTTPGVARVKLYSDH